MGYQENYDNSKFDDGAAVKRSSPIQEAISREIEALDRLEKTIEEARDKLRPVSLNSDARAGSVAENADRNPPSPTSPLAQNINGFAERTYRLNAQLQIILKNLEL